MRFEACVKPSSSPEAPSSSTKPAAAAAPISCIRLLRHNGRDGLKQMEISAFRHHQWPVGEQVCLQASAPAIIREESLNLCTFTFSIWARLACQFLEEQRETSRVGNDSDSIVSPSRDLCETGSKIRLRKSNLPLLAPGWLYWRRRRRPTTSGRPAARLRRHEGPICLF